ncbi:uncharacterized protein [Temnothorax longispinosus]|uniref:uncharacterized protein n=1 Tax=Temnothorax longispinosus TaxID=300112 RepID=UPI003A99C1A8
MLAGTKWGSHPQLLLSLYRAVFRGAIEYGAVVFQFKGNKQLFLALQRLQWKLIRNAMGYRVSTPINVILDEAKEPPLIQRFSYLIHNYLVKSFACRFNPVIDSLENVQFGTIGNTKRSKACRAIPIFRSYLAVRNIRGTMHRSVYLPFFSYPFLSLTYQPELIPFFLPNSDSISAEEANQHFRNHFAPHIADSITFYTDGSKLDTGAAGASVYSPDLPIEICCKLPPDVSTFTAEAWAIYETMFIIHQLQIPSAIIFSDCSSVLQTITSYNITHNNYIISLIRNMYYRAVTSGSKIKVAWIPSHKGITGNERADILAKRAARKGRKTSCMVPYIDLYHRSKYILNRRYQTYLENAASTKGTFYHTHYHTNNVKPWYYRLPLNRAQIVTTSRLRSGHYNLNQSLFRKNIVDSPSCPCGDPYQDANHIIFNCILTRDQTSPLHKYLQEKFLTNPTDIFPLLKNPPPKLCRLILAFFSSSNLYI